MEMTAAITINTPVSILARRASEPTFFVRFLGVFTVFTAFFLVVFAVCFLALVVLTVFFKNIWFL